MRIAKRPLNPDAVKKANEAVGRPLTMSPEDASARKKWMDEYLKAGGEKEQPTPPKPVEAPTEPCKPLVSEVCAQLKKEMEELEEVSERFELSAHVYDVYDPDTNTQPPNGYRHLSDQEVADRLGLASAQEAANMTHPEGSSFRAAVYEKGDTMIISYRGTTSAGGDILADAAQGTGFQNAHYENAKRLATKANHSDSVKNGGKKLEFVGHSLGGGLAATSGMITGAKTTTYNAAGVHSNTIAGKNPSDYDDNITSHVVDGEILNWAQDNREKINAGIVGAGFSKGVIPGIIAAALVARGPIPRSAGTRKSIPAVMSDDEKSNIPFKDRGMLHTCSKIREGIQQMRDDLNQAYKDNGCEDELGACGI